LYETRGFSIARVEGGREFSCITNELLTTPINIANTGDHVAEVERSIHTIKERGFGEITVTRGKEHLFLGMNIDFHKDGTATIKMKDYIKEAIADFGESITREATTPAKKTLFEIDESREMVEMSKSLTKKLFDGNC
jgi:hypothetical protein